MIPYFDNLNDATLLAIVCNSQSEALSSLLARQLLWQLIQQRIHTMIEACYKLKELIGI